MARKRKTIILGLGLDNKDAHIRITKGKNFRLYGGSEETHETMQEKAMKLNEQLDKRRKTLDNIDKEEFHEIAEKVGIDIIDDKYVK